jgi:hypothetical protein
MRGSALRGPAGDGPASESARLGRGLCAPVHPRPRGALPLVGSPASELPCSDTSGQGVRRLGTCAQGALLPETPAWNGGTAPFPPYPRFGCRVAP